MPSVYRRMYTVEVRDSDGAWKDVGRAAWQHTHAEKAILAVWQSVVNRGYQARLCYYDEYGGLTVEAITADESGVFSPPGRNETPRMVPV